MVPTEQNPMDFSSAADAAELPAEWSDFATSPPTVAGVYEWRVPSRACPGIVIQSLAHLRLRGAGGHTVLSPVFDHWDGYRVHVPSGTQWRAPPTSFAPLKEHQDRIVLVEGVDFSPCPFCHKTPSLHALRGGSGGGVVICSDVHLYNTWWLECCGWVAKVRYPDPRALRDAREQRLSTPTNTPQASPADDAGGGE